MMQQQSTTLRAWSIWAPTVLFFMYQFIIRVSPGVMQDDIMRRFSISAIEFGALSSIFYIAYASMQLPVGILLDRYGPRFIASSFLSLILMGILVFIYASDWHFALLGRALIGMGSAGGLLSTAKVTHMWFKKEAYAKILGISISIGVLGAIYGNYPLSLMISSFGWQDTLLILLGVGIILYISMILLIKNKKTNRARNTQSIWAQIKNISHHKSVIKLGLCGGLIGPFLYAYGDTWGISYLTTIHNLDKINASGAISALYIGVVIGFPLTAYICDKFGGEQKLTSVYALLTFLLFSLLLYIKNIPYPILLSIHFFLGVLCAYQVLLFGLVVKQVAPEESAFVTAIINMLNMAFGSIGIFIIGVIMEFQWNNSFQNNIRVYGDDAYKLAFSTLLMGLLLGGIWMKFMKIKNDR